MTSQKAPENLKDDSLEKGWAKETIPSFDELTEDTKQLAIDNGYNGLFAHRKTLSEIFQYAESTTGDAVGMFVAFGMLNNFRAIQMTLLQRQIQDRSCQDVN